jgi:hypothetical protein
MQPLNQINRVSSLHSILACDSMRILTSYPELFEKYQQAKVRVFVMRPMTPDIRAIFCRGTFSSFFETIKKKRTRSSFFSCPLNIHFPPMPGVEHAPAEAVRKFLWRARSQQAVLAPSLVLERSPNKSSSIRTIKKKRTRSNFFYCLSFNLSPCLVGGCQLQIQARGVFPQPPGTIRKSHGQCTRS